ATGEHLDLEERFRLWSDAYFRRRADPARLSPQVDNDPFLLATKLLEEAYRILGPFAEREHTINTMYLNMPLMYVGWLLYRRLWEGLVKPVGEDLWFRHRRARPDIPAKMAALLCQGGWLDNCLAPFLRRLRALVSPARLGQLTQVPVGALRARLREL